LHGHCFGHGIEDQAVSVRLTEYWIDGLKDSIRAQISRCKLMTVDHVFSLSDRHPPFDLSVVVMLCLFAVGPRGQVLLKIPKLALSEFQGVEAETA